MSSFEGETPVKATYTDALSLGGRVQRLIALNSLDSVSQLLLVHTVTFHRSFKANLRRLGWEVGCVQEEARAETGKIAE